MDRAYSLLEIRSVNDDERVIEGIATTPTTDRMSDVVEPMGAKFALPMPLLWQHNASQPVGHVEFAEPTPQGIPFRARIVKIDEPGKLKDRVDEAWQSVKSQLVRAVSIGFRQLSYEIMKNGGYRFTEWEWLELSLVTIPANAEATIQTIKSIDRELLAASGQKQIPVVRHEPPRVTGKTKTQSLTPKEAKNMNILEQIKNFEATRTTKSSRMNAIMEKAAEAGETLDAEQAEEYDGLKDEVKAIDVHLSRLDDLQKAQTAAKAADAQPIGTVSDVKTGSEARNITGLKAPAALEKGIRFARYAKCIAIATKTNQKISDVAETLYAKSDPDFIEITRAAVSAMTTGNTDALVGNVGGFADFVEFLTPMTILGRFGTGSIPALSKIPFRTPIIGEVSEADAQWVGEGKAKPLTRTTYGRTTLDPLKVATIAVQTMELIRDSSPSSDLLIRNALAKALVKRLDLTFLDPTIAAVPGVRPGSILNGIAAVTASVATGADGVRDDATAIMAKFVTANNPLTSGVWVMSGLTALKIMGMLNPLGAREFPGLNLQGGTFFELPVIVSNYVGDYLALVNAEDIHYGDEGGIDIAMSTEASLEMDSAPTHDSDTPTPAELVSMFQTNSVAFRAERTISWSRRRPSAAAWVVPGWN